MRVALAVAVYARLSDALKITNLVHETQDTVELAQTEAGCPRIDGGCGQHSNSIGNSFQN